MNNSSSNWLLWGLLGGALLIAGLLAYGIFLYNDLYASKTEGFEETANQILNQTSITEVEKVEAYHGSQAYHVVYGTNGDAEEKIIFYPLEGAEKDLTTIDREEIMSKEEIISQWRADCEGCEFIRAVPALEDDQPLWELAYNDSNNRYNLDYLSIYDGSRYEQYRFRKIFQ